MPKSQHLKFLFWYFVVWNRISMYVLNWYFSRCCAMCTSDGQLTKFFGMARLRHWVMQAYACWEFLNSGFLAGRQVNLCPLLQGWAAYMTYVIMILAHLLTSPIKFKSTPFTTIISLKSYIDLICRWCPIRWCVRATVFAYQGRACRTTISYLNPVMPEESSMNHQFGLDHES